MMEGEPETAEDRHVAAMTLAPMTAMEAAVVAMGLTLLGMALLFVLGAILAQACGEQPDHCGGAASGDLVHREPGRWSRMP